jgi:carboxymethylenebutenolidase
MGDMITISATGDEGTIPAYVAHPDGTAMAAVIVIPEIFGINAGIRSKVDSWAALGYLAIAPDIFWRFAPGVELDPDVPEQMGEAFGYFQQYDADLGVDDIAAVLAWTKAQGIAKTGLVGFCLGGRLAYMAATRTAVDAAVGYYGVMIDTMLDEAAHITKPLALHIPTADHFVSAEAQAAMHAGLDPNPLVTLWDYAGLDHGFAAETGNRRDEAAAQLADQRTRDFLAANLA